ncbi:regulator [Streptomyces antibioticus]|nr:SsgA family sporulation/cell division regulator [Streptomyces antibioticus]KUN18209.1 regulator [Streptomyces antibioticus]
MSGKQPDQQTRPTLSDGLSELVLDIERVLDLSNRQAVRATFRFAPEAPWVVAVELAVEDGPRVVWRIGRALLYQGLHSVSGLGDVQIWPSTFGDRDTARLQLTSRDTAALFELPVPPLAQWLGNTYETVPLDAELSDIDWDTASAALFQEPQARCD